jgi:hypothetical protein
MSPEQISVGKIDGRSDLFALAEVFYELLLRRHPFYASSDMEVLRSILDVDPPHPSSLDGGFPPELAAILLRAMRKLPGDRFPNAAAMHDALEGFLQAQRTPATTIMLGRYVRELFADRVETEQKARESGDDALLTQAMSAGRAEPAHAPPPRRRSSQTKTPSPDEANAAGAENRMLVPTAKSEQRDRVVEISRSGSGPADPAERGAPTFLAHSGYTDPGIQKKRFKSQVQRLFDDPADSGQKPALDRGSAEARPALDSGAQRAAHNDVDEDQLPTMLGTLSAQDLERLHRPSDPPLTAGAGSAPAQPASPTESGRPRDAAGAGAMESLAARKAGEPPRASGPPRRSGQPTPDGGMRPVRPAPTPRGQPAVTPRSRTVLADAQGDVAASDRWGLLLFVAGLGALAGAIIYAVILYASAQTPVMRLEVHSTPEGAAIYFDGSDTAAVTPSVFQNVAANQEHTLELRLEGFETHTRKIPPSPELGELVVNWTFRPLPAK